jgi:hypothetical protein
MDDDTRAAVAEAILAYGSPRFTVSEGRMLDLLTEIAERGDLTAFVEACHAYGTAFTTSRRVLEDYAPAKILSAYLCRRPGVDQSKAEQLRAAEPRWAVRIKDALWTPEALRTVVEYLHERLRTLSAPA